MSSNVPSRFVRALRVRAILVFGTKSLFVLGAMTAFLFVIAGAVVGAVVSRTTAVTAWVLLVLGFLAAAVFALRPLAALRGPRIAGLLAVVSPPLVSVTRSALELADDPLALTHAPALVTAQRENAAHALAPLRVHRVVPWSRALDWRTAAALGLLVTAVGLHTLWPRSRAGVYAIMNPATTDDRGSQFAMVVGRFDLHLAYPAYMNRAPGHLRDPSVIAATKGTAVEVEVGTRVTASGGMLSVAGVPHPLALGKDGKLHGRFIVHTGGPVVTYVDSGGKRLRDPGVRVVHALPDETPRVSLMAPGADLTVDGDDVIAIAYRTEDDVALVKVELVAQAPGGEPVRRTLAHFEGRAQRVSVGETHFSPAEVAAMPGDVVSLWIEATDNDDISGPNVGKSVVRKLTIASESSERAEELLDLAEVLSAGLDALSDRLELGDGAGGEARNAMETSARRFAEALAATPTKKASTGGVLREMGRRMTARLDEVRRASGKDNAARLHTAVVNELEKDVLLLSDLLDRGRLDDAAALAREIDALRRDMKELLAEYRQTKSEETKRKLLAAIQRAQGRMRELMERLAQMSKQVPSDFVNTSAQAQQATQDALRDLSTAVQNGNLDEADKLLSELEKQIDAMANGLGNGASSFGESRMGPREKALAEALDALSGLEAEQKRLAQRTTDLRKAATHKALANLDPTDEKRIGPLLDQVKKAQKAAADVPASRLDPEARELHSALKQRLADVAQLLKAQDLAEAQEMGERAADAAAGLARDLSLSSLMFPGREGETASKARAAEKAAREAGSLQDAIDRAIPRMSSFVGPGGEKQMTEDRGRQKQTLDASQKLAGKFNEAPDGMPLDPEAANEMMEAARRMADAENALGAKDPVGGSRAQNDAAEKLAELRRRMEQAQSQSSGGGGNGSQSQHEAVTIPSGDDHRSPVEVRRRLLDGMRERAPAGFESAVKRYYEELLR